MVLDMILEPLEGLHAAARYVVRVTVPDSYPTEMPKLKFQTPILHPNVSVDGSICFNLLQQRGVSIDAIASGMLWLLDNPNFDSPLNSAVVKSGYAKNVKLAIAGGSVAGVRSCQCKSPTFAKRQKEMQQITGKQSTTGFSALDKCLGMTCVIL